MTDKPTDYVCLEPESALKLVIADSDGDMLKASVSPDGDVIIDIDCAQVILGEEGREALARFLSPDVTLTRGSNAKLRAAALMALDTALPLMQKASEAALEEDEDECVRAAMAMVAVLLGRRDDEL